MGDVQANKTGVFFGYKILATILIFTATFAVTIGQLHAEQNRTAKTVQVLERDVVDLKLINSKMSEILLNLGKQDERTDTDIRKINDKLDRILLEQRR